MGVIAGVVLGIGLVWIFMWLWFEWLARSEVDFGFMGLAPSSSSPNERANAKEVNLRWQRRQAALLRRSLPGAGFVVLVGIVLIVLAARSG